MCDQSGDYKLWYLKWCFAGNVHSRWQPVQSLLAGSLPHCPFRSIRAFHQNSQCAHASSVHMVPKRESFASCRSYFRTVETFGVAVLAISCLQIYVTTWKKMSAYRSVLFFITWYKIRGISILLVLYFALPTRCNDFFINVITHAYISRLARISIFTRADKDVVNETGFPLPYA